MPPFLFSLIAAIMVSGIGFGWLAMRQLKVGLWVMGVAVLIYTLVFYVGVPSLAYPLYGWIGGAAILNMVIGAVVGYILADEQEGYRETKEEKRRTQLNFWVPTVPAVLSLLLLLGVSASGWTCFRATDYAGMIGQVEDRDWNTDQPPVDPKHLAYVPFETASFSADAELGEAEGGALGSQFELDTNYMTLQRINDHLWWVVPLDFRGWFVWRAVDGSPGYVMVDAQDPRAKPKLVLGRKFRYTPGAYFGDQIKRHIWSHGYLDKGLTDFSFEIDEDGKPWWIVTVYKPSIGFSGPKVLGVVQLDPETGEITFHETGKVPEWVDRVFPSDFVVEYANDWGKYWKGFWNHLTDKDNIRMVADVPGKSDIWIVYGSDGEPYWCMGITSSNQGDAALVGLLYVNSRTGKAHYYKMAGQSEAKIIQMISNETKFMNTHPARLYLFNIEGRPTWFSTLIGDSGAFKGVALVDAETREVFFGPDESTAFRKREARQWQGTGKVDPSSTPAVEETAKAKVLRIGCPVIDGGTICFMVLENGLHLTGNGKLVIRLSQTRDGDEVEVRYVKTDDVTQPFGLVDVTNRTVTP